jgi:hypothetical protein
MKVADMAHTWIFQHGQDANGQHDDGDNRGDSIPF